MLLLDWLDYFARLDVQIPPPAHPTYDLDLIVKMSLEEDLGPVGDVTTLATIPAATQAKATYVSKADGVFAGRGVAQVVIHTVDPSLKIAWRVGEPQLRKMTLLACGLHSLRGG